ncbi:MAG TPA: alpha/beta hydrolase [Pseudonocardia sp.]|jgi:pimeloyl-ACP methyl ester carboxylesterase|nr:alpha/beta hydrolase [Pseudonocardia sp.]
MAVLRTDDAELHYEVHGSGFPVLALAPGGMRSAGDYWSKVPWNPVAQLADRFTVITMDQRNAGASRAPITGAEGWATYAADQLAVLDELGVDRCHLVGMCIGGPFILALLRARPERFERAVILQSIGLDGNRDAFFQMFDDWRAEIAPEHPEADDGAWAGYRANMYGGPDPLFSVPDSVLPSLATTALVLRGNDQFHPSSASELIASELPDATFVREWKDADHLASTAITIADFLTA